MTFYKRNTQTHKECSKCNQLLPRTEFYKDSSRKDGITSYCKPCKLKINDNWRVNNPDTMKESQRNTRRKIEYGVSGEEYNSMLENQNYKCAICSIEIGREAAVDHCHTTNIVRGLLCTRCNTGLGMFKDSIDNLESAIKYLKK